MRSIRPKQVKFYTSYTWLEMKKIRESLGTAGVCTVVQSDAPAMFSRGDCTILKRRVRPERLLPMAVGWLSVLENYKSL
jgi:hypothetical protein